MPPIAGIAGHLRDQVQVHRDHRGPQAHPGTRPRRLATGMTGADTPSRRTALALITIVVTAILAMNILSHRRRRPRTRPRLATGASRPEHEVFCGPGNPGIAQIGTILATTDYLQAWREAIQPT